MHLTLDVGGSEVVLHELGHPSRLMNVAAWTELDDPGLDVEHRRPIDRVERFHIDAKTVDAENPAERMTSSEIMGH